jgi:hypothetical protein
MHRAGDVIQDAIGLPLSISARRCDTGGACVPAGRRAQEAEPGGLSDSAQSLVAKPVKIALACHGRLHDAIRYQFADDLRLPLIVKIGDSKLIGRGDDLQGLRTKRAGWPTKWQNSSHVGLPRLRTGGSATGLSATDA